MFTKRKEGNNSNPFARMRKLALFHQAEKLVVFRSGNFKIPRLSNQKLGGWVSQCGNLITLYNAKILGDSKSISSTFSSIASDLIFSWPQRFWPGKVQPQRIWEAKCYSIGAAVVVGTVALFRQSAAVAGHPAFKEVLGWQALVWSMGCLRFPMQFTGRFCMSHAEAFNKKLHKLACRESMWMHGRLKRAGHACEFYMKNYGEGLERTSDMIPAIVTVCMVPIRFQLIMALDLFKKEIHPGNPNLLDLWRSPEGDTLRLLTAQAFFFVADILKGNIPVAVREIRKFKELRNVFGRKRNPPPKAALGPS